MHIEQAELDKINESKCTNDCVFCYGRDFGKIEQNVQFEIKKLESIIELGEQITEIEISGDDPGEYPNLPQVVEEISVLTKATTIALLTHAKSLRDPAFTESLVRSGLTSVAVPVYGHKQEVHDAVTQRIGSFEKTCAGIAVAKEMELDVKITTLIVRPNQAFIKELRRFVLSIDQAASIGIPLNRRESKKFNFLVSHNRPTPPLFASSLRFTPTYDHRITVEI